MIFYLDNQSLHKINRKRMGLKDREDIYLYVSSIASGDTFPENTSSEFENRILPIDLDPNRQYEIGLSNILFPKFFYCIRQSDVNCSITFGYRIKESDGSTRTLQYTYLPERSLISNFNAKNISSITKYINNQLMRELQVFIGDSFNHYFPYSDIIYFDETFERVVVNEHIVFPNKKNLYTDIYVKFAPHIAYILGFEPEFNYTVFFERFGEESPDTPVAHLNQKPIKIIANNVARPDSGNDYLYIYSDLASPSRFGNQIVNILDAIPLTQNSLSKGVNPLVYKPLAKSNIQSVGIKITNQNGRPVYFEDGHSITCVLHIRAC